MKIVSKCLAVILICAFYTCSKFESDDSSEILQGNFVEVSPVNERMTLEFSSESQLKQRIIGLDIEPTFTIRLLSDNELELSCNQCDELQPKVVSYQIIDNNTFEIGGFSPAESTEILRLERIP